MDLTPYVENLRNELAVAAEAGGDEVRALAERLTAPLESSVRLTLLNALSAAADEITRDLAPGSVDVRLRGLEPNFVVTMPPAPERFGTADAPEAPPAAPSAVPPEADDGTTSRINLRLPTHLKQRVEEAASREGVSVNAWLTRAVAAAVEPPQARRRSGPTAGYAGPERYTGWVR